MTVGVVPGQRSFDDLGRPLADVTFVVLDLETTGGSAETCEITEVGAVKVRGGDVLGTFQTLVNPGVDIPPSITFLTGITEAMVLPAPPIAEVLEPFVRFIEDAVIVGHNVRFDMSFLAAAMDRHGWPRFTNVVVDTCGLARRLIRDEVPNCRLQTLAQHLGARHRPSHRALDDSLATTDVFHALLERAGTLGVLGLDDLVALPTIGAHPQFGKLTMTRGLPRRPGVYIFRDAGHRPLYVGKATDLRSRVRSYFTTDTRRKVSGLLRELASIDHIPCHNPLEAGVLEVRLIHDLRPRYNRQAKRWQSYAFVKLTLDEAWPRLSIVRQPRRGDGCLYVGPLGSARTARLVADAIETAAPIRRCAARLGATVTNPRPAVCTPAQLGTALCPCSGAVDTATYRAVVDQIVRGLTTDPELLLQPLAERIQRLSSERRYEEAADVRDRAAALVRAIERQRRHDAIRHAGRIELRLEHDGSDADLVIDAGILRRGDLALESPGDPGEPLPRHLVDEVSVVIAWLERQRAARLVACERGLAWPAQRLPTFEAREPRDARKSSAA